MVSFAFDVLSNLTKRPPDNVSLKKKQEILTSSVNKPGARMEKRIYLMNKCLLWSWKVAYKELTISIVQNQVNMMFTSAHTSLFLRNNNTQRHTVRPLINGESTGVTLQRRNNTECIEKLVFGDKYTTFSLQWIICTYWNFFLSKTKLLEKAHTSETWSALDNSQKLMSAYVSYKIDFQTIFG